MSLEKKRQVSNSLITRAENDLLMKCMPKLEQEEMVEITKDRLEELLEAESELKKALPYGPKHTVDVLNMGIKILIGIIAEREGVKLKGKHLLPFDDSCPITGLYQRSIEVAKIISSKDPVDSVEKLIKKR